MLNNILKLKKTQEKITFLLFLLSIFVVEAINAQNAFPIPSGTVQINEKSGNNRLRFQEIVEPNGESLVSMITGQQRGLLVKDRISTGGLWLIGGASTSTPTSAGGIGAGFVSDMATYLALAPNTSAITFLDGKINFFADKGFSIGQAYYPTPKMTVTSDGDVGLGTNPSFRFHIKGGNPNSNSMALGSTSTGNFALTSSDGGAYGLFAGVSGTGKAWLQAGRYDSNVAYDIILQSAGGNVGIGSFNPDARLAVNGTIHSTEVKVDLNVPGPDYVFEPNYDLKSLSEIETYIKENKHLPEVPSAKEMEKNGLLVGEMNMLLLKKVEELTLHLIEQQSKMKKMQEEIDSLKSDN
jgi:hypothetical protein